MKIYIFFTTTLTGRLGGERNGGTHDATHRGDKSHLLHCCYDKAACAYFVAAICRTNSNQFEFVGQIAATMIFTCHTRRFVAATCRGDVSQRFVASCVSALTLHVVIKDYECALIYIP